MLPCVTPHSATLGRAARPQAPPAAACRIRPFLVAGGRLSCRYTSLPERMGEQADNPSASTPQSSPNELHQSDEERRQHDAAAQQQAMRVLHDLEAAAVLNNPEAGHPESRRALSTVDYPPPEPPASPTGSWALFQGGTTTPTNTYAGSGTPGDTYSSEGGAREVSQDPDDAGRAVESIYDDNNLFVAWFEDP